LEGSFSILPVSVQYIDKCDNHLYIGIYGNEEKKFEVFTVVKTYAVVFQVMMQNSLQGVFLLAILTFSSSSFLIHDLILDGQSES
jgi:hypothetical protein